MAVIDTCNHLYLTVKHTAKGSSPWAGEQWQVGMRVRVGTAQESLDAGVVDLPEFSVQDAASTRTTTAYDVEQQWTGVTRGGNSITDSEQDALVAAVAQPFLTNQALHSSDYFLDVIKVYAVHKAPDGRWLSGAPNAYYPTTTYYGTAGTLLPPDAAAVMSFFSATRGPKGRGRVYLGSLAQTSLQASGRFSVPFVTGQGTAWAQAIADVRVAGGALGYEYTPVIWHRPGDKAGLENGTRGSVIARVEVNDIVDTQRRRDKQALTNWERFDIP